MVESSLNRHEVEEVIFHPGTVISLNQQDIHSPEDGEIIDPRDLMHGLHPPEGDDPFVQNSTPRHNPVRRSRTSPIIHKPPQAAVVHGEPDIDNTRPTWIGLVLIRVRPFKDRRTPHFLARHTQ